MDSRKAESFNYGNETRKGFEIYPYEQVHRRCLPLFRDFGLATV